MFKAIFKYGSRLFFLLSTLSSLLNIRRDRRREGIAKKVSLVLFVLGVIFTCGLFLVLRHEPERGRR